MQGLGPFAQNEFEEMCAEMGLEDKFRQVETQEAAKVAAAQAVVTAAEKKKSDAVAAALAAAAAAVRRKGGNGSAGQVGEEDSSDRLGGMTPEGLARHRRMVIKRKELTELQGMHEKVRVKDVRDVGYHTPGFSGMGLTQQRPSCHPHLPPPTLQHK